MRSLINNDLKRLLHNKLYWIACVVIVLTSIYRVFQGALDSEITSIDEIMGQQIFIIEFAVCFFLPIFIIGDIKNGMVKNKIIVGYSRFEIFASGLIASIISTLGMIIAWVVGFFPFAIAHFGLKITYDDITVGDRVLAFVAIIILLVTVTTFCYLLSVAISKKSVVIVVLVAGAMFYLTFLFPGLLMTRSDRIKEKITDDVTYEEARDDYYSHEGSPFNNILEAIDDVMFCGQDVFIANYVRPKTIQYIVADSVFSIIYAGIGYIVVKNKEFK